ncbi:porin [Pseudorhodoferax sp.]|uniref:porin n=1 Tax=Pseudorhodoferax sp. TaxID=1993553 RepID=UPI002DD679EC|nr:porin [Pseudorhodoferax sp.]
MKKSLFALSLLGASGLATAQSSMTLFGIIDVGLAHVSGSNGSLTGMTSSGRNFSRLGFRGREDLGDGLAASFHLEGQVHTDGGSGNGTPSPFNFARRSTVSLSNKFGELRLGRDFAATWWNTNVFDPGGDGVGGSSLSAQLGNAPGGIHGGLFARNSNAVSYFLPPGLGGLYGQVQHAFAESTASSNGNYNGLRLGFNAGKWNIAAAVGRHSTGNNTAGARLASANLGGFYDFDVAKLSFIWAREKATAAAVATEQTGWLLGLTVPIGAGELRAAYSSYDRKRSRDDFSKLMLGYGYHLSKRTEIYGTYARLDNKGGTAHMVSSAGLDTQGLNGPGGLAKGVEAGIRHAF